MRDLGRAVARSLAMVLAVLILAASAAAPVRAQDEGGDLAGLYTGSQAEVGAMLELDENGRYRYELSYGALDEWSAGTWTKQGDAVVLQSDPYVAPAFEMSEQGPASGGLTVTMDLPNGLDPQYFAVTLHRKDGSAAFESMTSVGLEIPMGDNPVVSLRPVLPVMDLMGPSFAVPEGGAALKIAFRPNDLGFAGFSGEVLARSGTAFAMARHGLTLRFRRVR
jgi:hypothetical protein